MKDESVEERKIEKYCALPPGSTLSAIGPRSLDSQKRVGASHCMQSRLLSPSPPNTWSSGFQGGPAGELYLSADFVFTIYKKCNN